MADNSNTMRIAVAVSTVGMCAFAAVPDLTIAEAGTRQFVPGNAYGSLVNAVSTGEVKLTSSGAAVEADAISFTNFNATADSAATTFYGGWWDFGTADTSDTGVNFMTKAATLSNRSVLLDNGAVVTNVGWAYIAGTGGTDNSLTLDGGSSFSANSIRLGCSLQKGQKSTVVVRNGSVLNVYGDLSLSDGSAWRNGKTHTDNELSVTGEGTRLVVGGQLSLGRDLSSSSSGAIGGSTFRVDNGASAMLDKVVVSAQAYHGECNRVVFGKNTRVTMTSFSFGAGGGNSVGLNYCAGSNICEIIDGAVVTNTGTLAFGADVASEIGNRIVVSNATFHTGMSSKSSPYTLIRGRQNELVVSGPYAKLTFHDFSGGATAFFAGADSTFIVENGAQLQLPVANFSYTSECKQETMLFRSGAAVTGANLATGNTYGTYGTSNRLVVASGASLALSGQLSLIGNHSRLEVDDGDLSVGAKLLLGDNEKTDYPKTFSGQVFRIAGSHPKVRVGWSLNCRGEGTKVVFALPSSEYDDGVATSENPIIRCGKLSGEKRFFLGSDSALVFENAAKFAASHTGRRRDYVLIESNNVNISAEQLAAASAGLPETMTLENTGMKLILHVRPTRGFILSVW